MRWSFLAHRIWRMNSVSGSLSRTCNPSVSLSCNRIIIRRTNDIHPFIPSLTINSRDISQCVPLFNKVVPFNLSDIGEGIGEVTIKEWYVNPGQKVAQFDSICEVQSDKASVTITSKFDGVIKRLYYEVDATAKVGLPLVDIELLESQGSGTRDKDEINDQDTSGTLTTTPCLPNIEVTNEAKQSLFHSHESHSNSRHIYKKTLATPAVRRLAMENRIDLSLVKGSGKDGRIMKEDVVEFLEQLSSPSSSQLPPLPEKYQHELKAAHLQSKQTVAQIQKDPRRDTLSSKPKADKRVLLTQVQRVMFKAMTESLKIPHLALSDDIEVSSLVAMKKKLFPVILKETGVYLTFLPFFMKAASLALEDFPILNSAMDDKDNNFLIHKSSHNIGFALDSPSGLLVPNVKQVQSKSILQISQEIRRIQEESRSKGVQASDLTEGTFTLSNIGSIGGVFGVPVILPPQVCIAAIGGVRVIPAFDQQGNVVKSHSLTMVWSADHRVIDGATVTRFNNRFKSFIQEPSLMLLHLK